MQQGCKRNEGDPGELVVSCDDVLPVLESAQYALDDIRRL